ncbi:Flp pilus assembly protein CpaB [Candidatus Clostridium radicumherbarum]|uniref:Flp pilus assembly protein CpaB n=1 Tax=Candidatus Clostridium radicumherbarum TaxID=3381662 RepID=A0ABW8TQR2_9CLOT
MKSKFILIGALVFAIITTFLFSNYVKNIDNKYKNDKNMVNVVVLKQNIKKDQKVTNDMVEVKAYSANSIIPGAIKNIKDIEGSYALVDMKAGEQLFTDRFSNQTNETEFLSRKVKEGNRAISIDANYVESVSTLIEPDDYVDVVFSEKAKDGTVNTQTILENIRVLAVGTRMEESTSALAGTKTTTQGAANTAQAEYKSITLELSPDQIKTIDNADERGSLKFVLRSKFEKK